MKLLRDWTFKWWEVTLLKLCLISFGIIIAIYFEDYIWNLLWLWWALFVFTAAYFIAKWIKEQ